MGAVCHGVSLGLSGALETRVFPFDQGHEFFSEFAHVPILRSGGPPFWSMRDDDLWPTTDSLNDG
jgi:hypothetical protein